MPLKKIADFNPQKVCHDKDHNPPSCILLKPGLYEHSCPSCGKTVQFSVPKITC